MPEGTRGYFQSDDVLAALPEEGQLPDGTEAGMTVKQLGQHFGAAQSKLQRLVRYLMQHGIAGRTGAGGPQDPFRYFRADPAKSEAADRRLTAEREATNTRARADAGPIGSQVLEAVADAFDPAEAAPAPSAYQQVARDLEGRAIEARREAEILTAAARLLQQICNEETEAARERLAAQP